MKNQSKKILKTTSLLSVLALPLFLAGCNTIEGAGTDIKHAGQALESSAERSKESSYRCPYCCQYHR